ncbi:apolipoprotein L3-like [Petromyzon marinus]|uniref:apolipoprotein L3-like n=1 Tax=Petromyzon marinus TaxID=7757 RepID=UPI003F72EA6C
MTLEFNGRELRYPNRGPPNYRQVRKQVIETFSEWKAQRIEILKYVRSNITQLRERSKNVNIAKITGATAGVAGGAMCIAGIALVPVTFGASLGLTIAGISVGVAGGTTSAGSVIAKSVMDKTTTKDVTAALEADNILTEELLSNMQCLFKAAGGGKLESIGITVVKSAAQIGISVVNVADDVMIGVVRGTAAAGLRIAGIALSGVLMVIDLASIVKTGIDLSKGSPSGLADQLQFTYDKLKLHLISMVKLQNQL